MRHFPEINYSGQRALALLRGRPAVIVEGVVTAYNEEGRSGIFQTVEAGDSWAFTAENLCPQPDRIIALGGQFSFLLPI